MPARSGSRGGSYAGGCDLFRRAGDQRDSDWRVGRRENPACAKFERHQLHDDLQCAGGELPNRLPCARHAADGGRDFNQQRDREHDVSAKLRQ
jgi:hypothetical protein